MIPVKSDIPGIRYGNTIEPLSAQSERYRINKKTFCVGT